jgi:hypothetical protein
MIGKRNPRKWNTFSKMQFSLLQPKPDVTAALGYSGAQTHFEETSKCILSPLKLDGTML